MMEDGALFTAMKGRRHLIFVLDTRYRRRCTQEPPRAVVNCLLFLLLLPTLRERLFARNQSGG